MKDRPEHDESYLNIFQLKKRNQEVFIKLNQKSTNCTLLIYSLPGDTCKYFVHDSGTQGTEG